MYRYAATTLRALIGASLLASALAGCSNKSETTAASQNAQAPSEGSSTLPANVTLSGSLAVDADANVASPVIDAKTVQLLDASGAIVAEGKTDNKGAYQIQIDTSQGGGLRLSGLSDSLTVQTLFLASDADDAPALGGRDTVSLDPRHVVADGNDGGTLDAGVLTARKVGAIAGRVTLETGGDATGIDIYVPGTTYLAKTDASGVFLLGFMPPGDYLVRADKDGFSSIEWSGVSVKRDQTTRIAPASMRISTGPSVDGFALADGTAVASQSAVELRIALAGAAKYRVSQLSDFRDTSFRPYPADAEELTLPFLIAGADGPTTIYLEAADNDGLSAEATLEILLDTRPPEAPTFSLRGSTALAEGYTNVLNPTLRVESCSDVDRLAFVESEDKAPDAGAFLITCADALANGIEVQVSDADGPRDVYLWARDAAGKVSLAPHRGHLIVDRAAPPLTVNPGSGTASAYIEVVATSAADATVRYTIDQSEPDAESPSITGKLVLIGSTTLKARAFDLAGNASVVVTREYTIDRDGPILGSIVLAGGAPLTRQTTISVALSAIGADFVMLSEDRSFNGAVWMPYATTVNYTFASSVNGTKTVYARFKDQAGNVNGLNGDLHDDILLDTTPPPATGITLLYPETPSGAFDKILLWRDLLWAEGTRYEVEVHSNPTYTDVVRSGVSDANGERAWRVNPPFTAPGTFYWRLRAVDTAGNTSAWIEGGDEKRFTIKLYKEAYRPTKTLASAPRSKSQYFGYRAAPYDGDLYLISTLRGAVEAGGSACSDCAIVDLVDVDTGDVLHTYTDGKSYHSGFGDTAIPCDVNGDNVEDIVISAPYSYADVGGNRYHNAGKVHVYDGATNGLLLEYSLDPSNGVYYCGVQVADPSQCHEFGYPTWPYPDNNMGSAGRDRQYTGQGIACVRRAGADMLAIGSPGWSNAAHETLGRVDFIEYTVGGSHYAAVGSPLSGVIGATEWETDRFGSQVVYLPRFKAGAFDGPVIAVGAPGRASGGSGRGAVLIYDLNGTAVATIAEPTGSNYNNYGRSIFPLGNYNSFEDSTGYSEFAVVGNSVVRVYNGDWASTTPEVLKSVKRLSNGWSFGSQVKNLGDMTGDGKPELGVSDISYAASGYWGVGRLEVFDYTAIDAIDASSQEESVDRRIVGNLASYQYTGSVVFAGEDEDNDGDVDSIILASPGADDGKGRISVYSAVSVSPGLPETLLGVSAAEQFGSRVISAGDFDADGTTDFVVTAPNVNYINAKVGRVYVVSGADHRVLHMLNGASQNQRFGTDAAYFDGALFVSDASGSIYRFDRAAILNVQDINAYAPGSTSSPAYPRRQGLPYAEIHIANEAMPVGRPYAPEDSNRRIMVHSTGNTGTDIVTGGYVTYYGAAIVYDRYFSDAKYLSDCRTGASEDYACNCAAFGTHSGEEFGAAAAFVPDMNGDGLVDFAVGAPNRDNGDGTTGAIYVFDGARCANHKGMADTDAVLVVTPKAWDSNATTTRFGSTIIGLIDYDGVGANNGTLLVSNQSVSRTDATTEGEIFGLTHTRKRAKLVNGPVTIFAVAEGTAGNNVSITMTTSTAPGDVWSSSCSASGNDITFVLGKCSTCTPVVAPNADSYQISTAIKNDAGCAAKVVATETPGVSGYASELLTPTMLTGGDDGAAALYTHLRMPAGGLFGANILNIGDENRDGWPDLAVAAPKGLGLAAGDGGQVTIYSSYALLRETGDASYPANAEMIKFYSPGNAFSNFGASLFKGDVSGDGIDDFVIGASTHSTETRTEVGAAYIYPVHGVATEIE